MMHDDADRILAFQHAYGAAWKLLFPAESLIERAQFPEESTTDADLQSGDRVLFITGPDCAVCGAVLRRLLGKTQLAEILITQDIRRGDVMIVFDPKGDADLLRRSTS